MAIDAQSERIVLRRAHTFLKSRNLKATARVLEKEARFKRRARGQGHVSATSIDGQSEWIVLRRAYAFLVSRHLDATAHALEHEARLKFNYSRMLDMLSAGRWRSADEYVSSFLGDDGAGTPATSAALFVVRFERFVGALKRGDRAWAEGYLDRAVRPVLASHPGRAAAWAACLRVLGSDPTSLREIHPDDAEYRKDCVLRFVHYINYNAQLYRCKLSFFNDELPVRFQSAATLGLRRRARPRRCSA